MAIEKWSEEISGLESNPQEFLGYLQKSAPIVLNSLDYSSKFEYLAALMLVAKKHSSVLIQNDENENRISPRRFLLSLRRACHVRHEGGLFEIEFENADSAESVIKSVKRIH